MTADLEPFRHSVVRILSEDGDFRGLGLRLADGIVITCAHVVGKALNNYDAFCEARPEGSMKVHAAVVSNASTDLGPARVIEGGWFPKRESKRVDEPADIAVLQLEKASGPSFETPPISIGLSLLGISFWLLGAPKGHAHDLVPIHGSIGQSNATGRYLLYQEGSGYRIEPGCSGAPVCDNATGQIIGIVVQDEEDRSVGVAFLIPPRELRVALDRAGLLTAVRITSPLDLIRHWVAEGIAQHDPGLGRQLHEFIDVYTGTAEQPLPFVGRDKELGRLRNWVADGELFFVTGSAGLGKSALLLHLVSYVILQQRGVTVLFVPISIRFETADELSGLRLLHVQLRALFAELRFAPGAHPDQTDYRERIERGWKFIGNRRERRFLLVIDGADEASGGWIENVLPHTLPANLAIVVSARIADASPATPRWLSNIRRHDRHGVACEQVVLPPLTKDAVKDAVVQLGHPLDEMAEQEAVMNELYRLTEQGDPLLVGLWASQLWLSRDQTRLQIATHLRRLAPGIGGFLDVWFQEQEYLWNLEDLKVRRERFEPLLHLFALARGTLTASDISALARHYRLSEGWSNTRFLERVLKGASRLLVHRVETGGFSFVHSRLAFHYRDELDQRPEILRRLQLAFIEWGRGTVERLNRGDLFPEECPVYLLQHYVSHVQDATDREISREQALDRYLLLLVLEPGWHRAWLRDERTYEGFLSDLSRVEQALRKAASVHHLSREIHCLLCRASIRSLTSSTPPPLFAQLVDCGLWNVTRALKTIRHLELPNQVEALLGLVAVTAEDELISQLLAQALTAAEAIEDAGPRAEALVAVAGQLSGEPALLAQVLAAAQAIKNKLSRAKVLAAVAGQLRGEARRNALAQALAAADKRDHAEVLAAAQAIRRDRAKVRVAVAGQLRGEARRNALAQALAAAQAIEDPERREKALVEVAGQLSGEPALLAQVLAAAQAIRDEEPRAEALAAVAGQLSGEARRNALAEALAAAQETKNEESRARALVAVAGQLSGEARRNALEQALAAAQAIHPLDLAINDSTRAEALAVVIGQLRGEPTLLAQALAAAQAPKPNFCSGRC